MLELSAIDLQKLIESELQGNPVVDMVSPFEPSAAGHEESILPDLILQKVGGKYVVFLNDNAIPELRTSEVYERLMDQPDTSDEVKDYIRRKMNTAERLIDSLEQRRKVMLAIGDAIAEFQKDFLENPTAKIKAIDLPEIAVAAGLTETGAFYFLSNKYIETPSGVFELARFFQKDPWRN